MYNGYNEIKANTIVMEGISSLCIDQDSCDRLHYKDIAIESITNTPGKGRLVQQLYADIIAKSNIDFGDIPASKGDLTRCKNYDLAASSVDTINKLFEGSTLPNEIKSLNEFHELLIALRGDFEFGFKFDVEIIKLSYNVLVMSFYEMIDICILAYANYLKEVKNVDFKFKTAKGKDAMVLVYVNSFIQSYKKGEWGAIMKQFKGNSSNLLGNILSQAQSGIPLGSTNPTSPGINISLPNPSGVVNALGTAGNWVAGKIGTPAGKVATWVVAAVAIFLIIRSLIYFFITKSAKVSNWAKTQTEFLKWNADNGNNTKEGAVMQSNVREKLEDITDIIESKILKTEDMAKKKLKESNRENFNIGELNAMDSAIELL